MVDFSKFDFAKFDTTKMFDAETVINNIDKTNQTVIGLITDLRLKSVAEDLNSAGLDLVRAQVMAMKDYGAAVKKAFAV